MDCTNHISCLIQHIFPAKCTRKSLIVLVPVGQIAERTSTALANYRVCLSSCSILWGGKYVNYATDAAHVAVVWCISDTITNSFSCQWMLRLVFWDVTPCSIGNRYQSFRGTCCMQHQGRRRGVLPWTWERQRSSEMLVLTYLITQHHIAEDCNLSNWLLFCIDTSHEGDYFFLPCLVLTVMHVIQNK
jgi:hypothetical protein